MRTTRDDIIYRSRHSRATSNPLFPGHQRWTTGQLELLHERDDIKGFYSKFQGEVIVGIKACGYTNWFEELLEQLGHKLRVGDAAEIRRLARRRQKNDRRDADLLLDLPVHNEFPALFRYSRESRELLPQLRYRHKLVKLRTMVANTLHALAINAGLSLRQNPSAPLG